MSVIDYISYMDLALVCGIVSLCALYESYKQVEREHRDFYDEE
jgi:uncharacterized membrane protein YozB (DUF420 family)